MDNLLEWKLQNHSNTRHTQHQSHTSTKTFTWKMSGKNILQIKQQVRLLLDMTLFHLNTVSHFSYAPLK